MANKINITRNIFLVVTIGSGSIGYAQVPFDIDNNIPNKNCINIRNEKKISSNEWEDRLYNYNQELNNNLSAVELLKSWLNEESNYDNEIWVELKEELEENKIELREYR